MTLDLEYEQATRDAELARLRRVLAVRAMLAEGESQREVGKRLGITQPAISYQVASERTDGVRPSELIAAGGSVLRQVAERRGFSGLAVFGSAARGDDQSDSDIDFLVQPPVGADLLDMARLEESLEAILGRGVDLVSYRGLDPKRDRDILNDRVLL
ncbi:MAG: nucleotidyltransferase domain-containing protein [Cryobacterium sp.]|nr:nucleotidyltransferase domain-containing protein [Cryobacterium sp.]MBX3089282.1 nucleotidyltransferase domain-containing protein [Cryobacterium sp.]MBX3116646.1 nucleotidyltransferase domain-containing protein [Cryobacterium sp.]MCO5294546.1 nucleotidyltransferase domain-containing protein [Homoserinimonas sp.]MCW5944594.1 nucleotidyltransferase domain-containing protein [Cryobacterium sp.]